jgi:hypothetical protein
MNRHDEIKNLIEASKKLLNKNLIIEDINHIRKNHGLILEQGEEGPTEDQPKNYETAEPEETDGNKEDDVVKTDKSKGYRISGGIIVIHGKDKSDLQLTSDDKKAFQETMDDFVTEVSEIVDFNKLNLYSNNVEWSGKITELDVEFFYSIGETNGIYINGTMTKIDDDYLEFLNKLKQYYEKFKSKWSKVIASRKKTPES